MRKILHSSLSSIGHTPVVRLNNLVSKDSADVLVKLESFNPTGAYKDRMALAMIEEPEKRGELKKGMTVLEYTGGSTGSSLAFVCAVKGYDFHVVSSDAFAVEKLRTMEAFGAKLELIKSPNGKITPDLIPRIIERTKELAKEDGVYFTDQLNNLDAKKGYATIGEELLEQVEKPIDVFCASVGTAGMLMGVSDAFRKAGANPKMIALEPESSAVISTGKAGSHGVEGIGIGFTPPMLDRTVLHEVRAVKESDARNTAQRLAREEGIFAGISSGLNVFAALQIAEELGKGRTVVTVACDSGLKYLAGDLFEL